MKASGLAASIVGAVLLCWGIGSAAAADFYVLNFQTDDFGKQEVTLLDPATIAGVQNGHKIVHFTDVHPLYLWGDDTMEVDCTTPRWQTLSSISHLPDDSTFDRLAVPGAVRGWKNLSTGSVAADMRDVVCRWPNDKPTGDAVLTAPDFRTAVDRISEILFNMQKEKK